MNEESYDILDELVSEALSLSADEVQALHEQQKEQGE